MMSLQLTSPNPAPIAGRRASSVRQDVEISLPPDLKPHVVRAYDLAEVFVR